MQHVRIENDSPVGNKAKLTIGGQIIPFYEATIHIATGEFVTLQAKVPVEALDVIALESQTQLEIKHGPVKVQYENYEYCDRNFKRGWWCSRQRGHSGPCALRPKWWNIAARIKFRGMK